MHVYERQTDRHRETNRHTERQPDRHRETARQIRHRERETEKDRENRQRMSNILWQEKAGEEGGVGEEHLPF